MGKTTGEGKEEKVEDKKRNIGKEKRDSERSIKRKVVRIERKVDEGN